MMFLVAPLREVHMNKNKHLTQSERLMIELFLNRKFSFKAIGRELLKDPTTIAKEVKNHIVFKSSGSYGRPFNDCLSRNSCIVTNICGKKGCHNRTCKFCASTSCTTQCIAYQKETCQHLNKPPYICNGCELRRNCTLEKKLYIASDAQKEYEIVRSEARQGIQLMKWMPRDLMQL